MDKIPEWFWADRLTPVNFYGYTSSTRDRIYELDFHSDEVKSDEIERFVDLKRKCMMMYVDMSRSKDPGPVWHKDIWDDKVVIECRTERGDTIFVGYWGFTYSIGRAVSTRNREPRPYKQVKDFNTF